MIQSARTKIYVLSLTSFITTFFFNQVASAATFTDVNPTDWFYNAVEQLVADGSIGDKFTTYRPADSANRAEAAMLIYKSQGYDIDQANPATPTFKDVPKDFWGYTAIETLAKNGIIVGMKDEKGNPTGYFNPGDLVTREQFTKMAILGAPYFRTGYIQTDAPHFSDVPVERWSYSYIETGYSWEIIKGYPDGKFYPERNINRAEMADITLKIVTGIAIVDPPLYYIEDVSPSSEKSISVCFEAPLDENLTTTYTITDSVKNSLEVVSVEKEEDPQCQNVTTALQKSGEKYQLKVTIKDEKGEEVFSDEAEFKAGYQDPYITENVLSCSAPTPANTFALPAKPDVLLMQFDCLAAQTAYMISSLTFTYNGPNEIHDFQNFALYRDGTKVTATISVDDASKTIVLKDLTIEIDEAATAKFELKVDFPNSVAQESQHQWELSSIDTDGQLDTVFPLKGNFITIPKNWTPDMP